MNIHNLTITEMFLINMLRNAQGCDGGQNECNSKTPCQCKLSFNLVKRIIRNAANKVK